MSFVDTDFSPAQAAPIDMLEHVFDANGWAFERSGNEEITTSIKAGWATYELRALWRDEERVLQIIARADLAAADDRRMAAYETLGLINEQLWMGHFELWSADGSLLFRHATLLADADGAGEADLSIGQAEMLVDAAVDEFERYYPVFQLVLFADHSPQDAMAAALLETVGEA
ncbi:YbjN domain-containing protein [Sandarakinorhabdus sp.]|uniref:YbjN domain-containing protein n=1 Tax=Sandarakinorhabdus sp. TaxID=1916663 RepID=UPI00286E673E|nr:YbjN domain-containing protein [Sandarakinorhabdus sp.]